MSEFWVFGYGSLMWKPGFTYVEKSPARLKGYHRSLCVYSTHHRGTPEKRGLVLGLDHGGSCVGMAFRVCPDCIEETHAYLKAREMISYVYKEKYLSLILQDGRKVQALAYCIDRTHKQYARGLSTEEQLTLVANAEGLSGKNPDYVIQTVEAMRELGIHDYPLEKLALKLGS
jgi:glutathione-specific gamma-glutamylcyclotransferase